MEFLSYSLEDRTSMFLDGIEFSIDVLSRNKNLIKNLDMKDICDFDKNMMVLDRETVIPNSFLGSTFYGVSSSNEMNDSLIHKEPSTTVNLDHFTQDFELDREHYGPNNQKESVLNNLQMEMEKCTDSKDISTFPSSEESMVEDSLPAKKARITDLCSSQIPFCQVQGCYKDLSSSKDYHKRHRVCDIHSKTAKVIIRGIEQRFCQQCSRFHLLSEFDDGKRSCRKRLAGHNQRRRKPQFSTAAALDSKFFRLSLMKTESFLAHKTFGDDDFIYQESKNKQMKLSTLLPIGISEKSLANLPVIRNQHQSRTCINGGAVVDSSSSSSPPHALSLLSAKSSNKQGRSHHSITGFLKMMTTPSSTKENQDQKSTKTADVDNYISPEIESTVVDLVELSSHLQRVQQLRNSM